MASQVLGRYLPAGAVRPTIGADLRNPVLGGAPVSQVLPVARRIWAAEFGSADASPRHDGRIRIAITRTATAQQVKHNGQPI